MRATIKLLDDDGEPRNVSISFWTIYKWFVICFLVTAFIVWLIGWVAIFAGL